MLMYKEEGGFHNFRDEEVEQAMKDGWADGQKIFDNAIASKIKTVPAPIKEEPIAKQEEPAIIELQPEPRRAGRPRWVVSGHSGSSASSSSSSWPWASRRQAPARRLRPDPRRTQPR